MTKGKLIKKKSKRLSCHKKYKIARKVREHNRKQRKEAKKTGNSKFRQAKKDPGVPNCPFKEEVLKEAERLKKEGEAMKEKQKRKRLEELMKRRKIGASSEKDLVKNAEKRAKEFAAQIVADEDAAAMDTAESTRDPSRNYIRVFNRVVEAADVILEVLDARDPLRSRCPQVEEAVISAGTNKKLVLLLNKVDLVPKEIAAKWIKYLRNEFPTLAFKSSTQNQKNKLARSKMAAEKAPEELRRSSHCLGADALVKLLANYGRSLDGKTAVRVGVVGFPNVGKSSVINSLKRAQACETGSVPGVTKTMQEVRLDKHVVMIDSPGVVMSSSVDPVDRVLRNCTRLDLAGVDASQVVDRILARCSPSQMTLLYKIPHYSDAAEFLSSMARKTGRLKKGGVPDVESAAARVVDDWNGGKIRYYTHPPDEHTLPRHLTSEIVTSMSAAFDLDAIENLQTLTLDGLRGTDAARDMLVDSAGFTDGRLEEAGEEDGDDDDDEDDDKKSESMVDDLAAEAAKMKRGNSEDVVVVVEGPSPAVSKKTLLKTNKGKSFADRLQAKTSKRRVTFDESSKKAAVDAEADRANKALKKQFKKSKKERRKSEKVASSLASDLDHALKNLGKPTSGGDGDGYDFSVL